MPTITPVTLQVIYGNALLTFFGVFKAAPAEPMLSRTALSRNVSLYFQNLPQ
jgi:hypothetical protein